MNQGGELHRELLIDPTVTGVNRLPVLGSGVLADDIEAARIGLWRRTGAASSSAADAGTAADGDEFAVDLDGTWTFKLLDRPEHVTPDDLAGPTSTSGEWSKIVVPGTWTLQGPDCVGDGNRAFEPPHYTNVIMPFKEDPPDFPELNPTGVYRRTVTIPRTWKGRRTILRVGGAESVVQVFVSGQFVGGGSDSRLPSEFDLSDFVTPGRRAVIAIVVAKWSAHTWLEDQDQWWHGGIQRSVSLRSVPVSGFTQVKLLPGLEGSDGTLSLEARLDGPVVRQRGWTVELTVETTAKPGQNARTISSSGPIDIPIWEDGDEASSLLSGMFIEPGVVRSHLVAPAISPWSHEAPTLYRALLILRDTEREVVQVYSANVGFRSVQIAGNELLINNKPVLLHGVNLHEHSPDTGRAVTAEQTRADLLMMKAHNLNSVRAAHYPHDEHLAELCDELGLYLIDEANIESHARQASLCHDARYLHPIVERVQRMVERDQHHPSIIVWSLGNESGYGAPHDAAAAWLRRYDPSRPVQYEGPFMHDLYAEAPVSDIVCPMYASIADISSWASSGRDDRRPLILCEYSHAMGNSNGSLADYWEAFETTPGLQGGFIWEWVDHGLKLFGEDGKLLCGPLGSPSWAYGGDFGGIPNDSNFVCDGLVSADRVAGPALAEVHYLGRPVTVTLSHPVGQGRPKLHVRNRRWFSDTSDLRATWELLVDGDVVNFGDLELGVIEARSETFVALPFPQRVLAKLHHLAEVHLNVVFTLRRRNTWARSGHVVAIEQMEIPVRSPESANSTESVPDQRVVSRASAQPIETTTPFEVATIPWKPTVFRALTDNDGLRSGWMRGLIGNLSRWVDDQGLDRAEWIPGKEKSRTLDPPNGSVTEIVQNGELVAGNGVVVKVKRVLTRMSDRWTRLDAEMRIPAELADIPRVGLELTLDDGPGWSNVEWFGDGPHECYPDRLSAARLGRWRESIENTYVDHAVPQEHGHRTGLRWMALTRAGSGRSRVGMLVVVEPRDDGQRPGFAVRRHSDDQLWRAQHSHDLVTEAGGVSSTYLYLDMAQRGIGTGSCGPDALEQYRVPAGRHRLRVWICGFDPRSEDPGTLAMSLR